MKILCLLEMTRSRKIEDFGPYQAPEEQRVWELYRSSVIREMYFRSDAVGAVLVLETTDVAEAEAVIGSLPMVKGGLFDIKLLSLNPFTPLEILFASQHDNSAR